MSISTVLKKVVVSGVIASALIGGVAAAPTVAAYAEQTNPPAQTNSSSTQAVRPIVDRGLARALKVELRIQERQGRHLDRANRVINRIQARIDKAVAAGKNVDAVKTALATFKDSVSKVQGIHTAAGQILDTHAGFTDGKVTDAAAALTTITGAGAKQKEFAETLKQAGTALREALKTWKESNTI